MIGVVRFYSFNHGNVPYFPGLSKCTSPGSQCTNVMGNYPTLSLCWLNTSVTLPHCPSPNYLDSTNRICVIENCNSNCQCNSTNSCTDCIPGYYYSTGTCSGKFKLSILILQACPTNCAHCTNSSYCSACTVFYRYWDGSQCACPPGTTSNSTGACTSTPSTTLSYTVSECNTITVSATLPDTELAFFPTRVYSWTATTNSSNSTLNNGINSFLSSINTTNFTISYWYLSLNLLVTF